MSIDPTLQAALIAGAVALLVATIPPLFSRKKTDAETMEKLQGMLNKAMTDIEGLQTRLDEKDNPIRVTVEIETSEPRILGARVTRLPRISTVENAAK